MNDQEEVAKLNYILNCSFIFSTTFMAIAASYYFGFRAGVKKSIQVLRDSLKEVKEERNDR